MTEHRVGTCEEWNAARDELLKREIDVTMISVSRAPIEKILAYKRRMGCRFPWASSYESDYGFDFGFAATEEQKTIGELARTIDDPPDFLKEWAVAVGADLTSGLGEGPGWSVFALEDGVVYHTYSPHPPDGVLLAPYYYQLLDQTPRERGEEMRAIRHDEYEDA
jgi:predicted dithiol-disulfide oxidoreductase (DUF899 family)